MKEEIMGLKYKEKMPRKNKKKKRKEENKAIN